MAATIGTRIHTFLKGRCVGRDAYGNRYYEARRARAGERHKRRWVIYEGIIEASKVPPAWHGWLHYTHAAPLPAGTLYAWQKEHQPDLTGTPGRYLPPGAVKGGARPNVAADYQPWVPRN